MSAASILLDDWRSCLADALTGLRDHLREVQALEQRQHASRQEASPTPSLSMDPLFFENPYDLGDSSRAGDAAKASAAKRDREVSATKRAAQNRAAQVRTMTWQRESSIHPADSEINSALSGSARRATSKSSNSR